MPHLHQNVSNLPRSLIPKRHESRCFFIRDTVHTGGDVLDRDLSAGEVYDLHQDGSSHARYALDSVRQAEVCAATRGHGTNETKSLP